MRLKLLHKLKKLKRLYNKSLIVADAAWCCTVLPCSMAGMPPLLLKADHIHKKMLLT
jgi:hypothetical protein